MRLNVYHQALRRILSEAQGRTNRPVPLREALKKERLHGSYEQIHELMTREGWLADAPGLEMVVVTTWGEAEMARALATTEEEAPDARAARELADVANELANLLEERAELLSSAGGDRKAGILAASAREMLGRISAALSAAAAPLPPEAPTAKTAPAKREPSKAAPKKR